MQVISGQPSDKKTHGTNHLHVDIKLHHFYKDQSINSCLDSFKMSNSYTAVMKLKKWIVSTNNVEYGMQTSLFANATCSKNKQQNSLIMVTGS